MTWGITCAIYDHLEAIWETPVIRTERVDFKGVASTKHANDAWAS